MSITDEYYFAYDAWCNHYDHSEEEMKTVHRYISFFQKDILEIGCGTGRFTQKMLSDDPTSIIAIDNSPESLEIAKIKITDKRVSFVCMDAYEYHSFFNRQQTFDYVVFSWSLHKLKHIASVLGNYKRLLNPNGALIILSPITSDYDYFMRCVRYNNNEENQIINQLIDFLYNQSNSIIDYIKTSFLFSDVHEAFSKNSFFWIYKDGSELKKDEIDRIYYELNRHLNSDGSVEITDKVILGILFC